MWARVRPGVRCRVLPTKQEDVDEDEKPHPRVGVVVAKDREILAVAHRGEIGAGAHAEFAVLEKKLPDDAVSGATVYTTLEPCTTRNHPKVPCTQRLIERRIRRVVFGILDPDDRIRGLGIRQLEQARIAIEKFPLELVEELLDLNRYFIKAKESEPSEPKASSKYEEMDESVDLLGIWYGFWSNPDGRTGEEVIHVLKREGNSFIGSFFDKNLPEAPVVFEGTFRKPYLRVQYHSPYSKSEGKGVMEDGSCFLKLQDDGAFFKGFYAGFDNYGEYELRRESRTGSGYVSSLHNRTLRFA